LSFHYRHGGSTSIQKIRSPLYEARLRALDTLRLHRGISRAAYLDERVRLLRLQAAALEAMREELDRILGHDADIR
jgi:hypothetical protein